MLSLVENLFKKNPLQDLLSSLNVKIFEEKFLLKAPSREVRRPPLTSTKKSRQAEFRRLPLPNLKVFKDPVTRGEAILFLTFY